jgi:hypothetical protein
MYHEYNPISYLAKLRELHNRISIKEEECRELREEFINVTEHQNGTC